MLRIFGFLLLVYLIAWSRKDALPPVAEIDRRLAVDPIQTETKRAPFAIQRDGVTYHVRPLADYELRGLVVSYHDSESWLDIYHGLWNDRLNFRDLGVVWGFNALGGVYRDVEFSSGDFTLNFRTSDNTVWSSFRLDQVANNHILAARPDVEASLRRVGKGDQILIRGVLCEYSHPGGTRSSSLTRSDTGNGACETICVDSVSILREANGGWRSLFAMSGFALKLMVPLLIWQAWSALRSPSADRGPSRSVARYPRHAPARF